MKYIRYKYVTLLEMLIAISLVTILLSTLMGFYSFTASTQSTIDKLRNEGFRSLYIQHRLGQILPKANEKSKEKKDKSPFWFYTSVGTFSPELVFTYDNGVDATPRFSNIVLGKLFLEGDKLTLLSWSTEPEWRKPDAPARKEVFEEGIVRIAFSFYNPPPATNEEKPIEDIKNPPGWFSEWEIDREKLPAMIKITLWKEGEETPKTYGFVMSNSDSTILYKR